MAKTITTTKINSTRHCLQNSRTRCTRECDRVSRPDEDRLAEERRRCDMELHLDWLAQHSLQ
jgi:hypothetical protein